MNFGRHAVKEDFEECPLWSTVGERYDWPRDSSAHDEEYVMYGRFDEPPQPSSKVVRIFLSSTFTDTYAERNLLIKDVYPRLKKRASEKYGLDFQVVDMRWGVRDEATVDHSTSSLCKDEIAKSKNLSIGPTFVALLSHRYGGRFLPTLIPNGEMDAILKSLKEDKADEEDIELLQKWFRLDTNAIPPEYCLLPIIDNDKVDGFLKEQDFVVEKYKRGLNAVVYEEELKEDTDTVSAKKLDSRAKYAELLQHGKEQWRTDEPRLANIIRRGARIALRQGHISEDASLKYFRSITEEEIRRGILQEGNVNDRCLVFIRDIQNINLDHKKAWRFIDMEGDVVDKYAQQLLETLKKETLPEHVPKDNIFTLTTTWNDNDGVSETDNASYLKEFCKTFEDAVWQLIERNVEKKELSTEKALYMEVLEHTDQCIQKGLRLHGRQDVIENIKSYIMSTSLQPLVVYGQSGAGKTSLMAKTALEIPRWLGNGKEICIVLRFCGTTPESSNSFGVLTSMAKQIVEIVGLQEKYTHLPDDLSDLQEAFENILGDVPADKKLIILVDSLDQLSDQDDTDDVAWFPRQLPRQVKLIVSLIGDEYSLRRNMNRKRPILTENQFVEVTSLDKSTGHGMLLSWLKNAGRCLSEQQDKAVENLIDSQVSPMYIKLLFDEIKRWKSFDNPVFDCTTVPSCLQRLFRRLETKHGAVIVSRAFGYLTACTNGLTELEMEDILSIDDEVLTNVFQFHVPPIRRLPSILWSRIRSDMIEYIVDRGADGVKVMSWYHRQFLEEAKKRYLPTKTTRVSLNTKPLTTTKNYRLYKTLAEFFAGVWANDEEKPFTYTPFQCKRLGITVAESSAVRYVTDQPIIFGQKCTMVNMNEIKYNRRKISELPAACLNILKHEDMTPFVAEHVALNQNFLGAWIMTSRWEDISYFFKEIIDEHQHMESSYSMQRQVRHLISQENKDQDDSIREMVSNSTFGKVLQISAVYHCLLLSHTEIQRNPNMIGADITGRLLPLSKSATGIGRWVEDTDGPGRDINALVPPHRQLRTPGDELEFIVDTHDGPIQESQYYSASASHYLLSTSRKFVLMNLEDGNIYIDVTPANMPQRDSFNKVVVGEVMGSTVYFVSLRDTPHVYMYSQYGKELGVIDVTSCLGSEIDISAVKVIEQSSVLIAADYNRGNILLLSNFTNTTAKPNCDVIQCGTAEGNQSNNIVQIIVHPENDKILVIRDIGHLELYNAEKDKLATRSFEWWPIQLISYEIGRFGKTFLAVGFTNGQFCMLTWDSSKDNLKNLQPNYLLSDLKVQHNISYGVPHYMFSKTKRRNEDDMVVLACTNKHLVGFESLENTDPSSSSSEEDSDAGSRSLGDRRIPLNLLFRIKKRFTVASISKYMKHLLASDGDRVYIFNTGAQRNGLGIWNVQYLTCLDTGQNVTDIIMNPIGGEDLKFTAVCQNSQMLVYDLQKLGVLDKYIPKFDHSESEIAEICANGDTAITFSATSSVGHVWNIATGKIVTSLKHPNQQKILKVAANQSHHSICILNCNGEILLWQKESNKPDSSRFRKTKGHNGLEQICDKSAQNYVLIDSFKTSFNEVEKLTSDDIFMLLLPNKSLVLASKHHSDALMLTLSEKWQETKVKGVNGPFQYLCHTQSHSVLFVSSDMYLIFDTQTKHISSQLSLNDMYSRLPSQVYAFLYVNAASELWVCSGNAIATMKQGSENGIAIDLKEFAKTMPCKAYLTDSKQIIILQNYKCAVLDTTTKTPTKTFTFGDAITPIDHSTVTPDGKYIVYTTEGREIYLYRISDGKILAWFTLCNIIISLAVSANSTYLLLGTSDKRLFILIIADPDEPSHGNRIQIARNSNPGLSWDKGLITLGLLNELEFDPEEDSDSDSNEKTLQSRTAHMQKEVIKVTTDSDSSCDTSEESDVTDSSHNRMYTLTPCTLQ